jgi:hypothetical protein
MYKHLKDNQGNISGATFTRPDGSIVCFAFDPANTDYAEFKKAVTAGAELQDADGNVMTEQAAQEFVRGLP